MAVWLVRAGSRGEREDFALDNNVVVIGWEEMGDLTLFASREALHERFRSVFGNAKPGKIANWVGQVWAFKDRIEKGDLVVLPLKKQPAIAIGEITGPYKHVKRNSPAARNTRPVRWIKTDIPRTAFGQDLLYSLGAFMTVCQIRRNNAEERIRAILEGKQETAPQVGVEDAGSEEEDEFAYPVNLEEDARNRIQGHITQRLNGRKLEILISELLQAQGYVTELSPTGPDGGVDIIARQGALGFDGPRLCAQCKFRPSKPQDVKGIRELQGTMQQFSATHGLFVSWGGFTRAALKEARRLYFDIRLWDADDVIDAIFARYEKLPGDMQAMIPLKRIWTLVPEDGEG